MSRVSSVRCPSCGSDARAAEEYCTRCGNDLTSPGLLPILDDPADRTEVIDARPSPDRLRAPEPPRRRRSRAGRAVALVLGAALLFAAGYAGYRVVGARDTPAPVAQGSPVPSTPPVASSQPASRPLPAQTGPLVVPAPGLVGRPETAAVVALFTRYFDGINRRDYDAVQGSFTAAGRPLRDRATFDDQYRTTRDSDVRVFQINPTDAGYLVSISFTSHQNPADAPDDAQADCVNWSMAYPVVRTDTGLLIDKMPATSAYRHAC